MNETIIVSYGVGTVVWFGLWAIGAFAAGITARSSSWLSPSARRKEAQEALGYARRALLAPVWPVPLAIILWRAATDVTDIAYGRGEDQ